MNLIGDKFVKGYFKVIEPIIEGFVKSGIHPNTITWAGLFFTIFAANFFRLGSFFIGGIFLVIAGTCDVLDGQIARRNDQKSKFGAFFDSAIDRYSDIVIFLGIAIYFDQLYIYVLIVLALTGSLLTSYMRARAGALKIDCKVGFMQRPERITYVAGAAIFDGLLGWLFKTIFGVEHLLIIIVLWFVAIVSHITVLQRIIHVKKKMESLDNE
ncbi:MAG: CDP-alcohol phosphatidyltransferase family protein [candidate division Zixibacteria bacterium]|nr:CDP-alcohol phosphatidyltransferase family protein [candidate division Zixibacteria bacterium]